MDSSKLVQIRGTPSRLSDDDFCSRLEFLGRSWEKESLSPMQLLARGIEHGLTSESEDGGQAAGDRVMSLAVSRPIDTLQSDLLGLAEHTSALADYIVWLLRTGDPWKRPTPVKLNGQPWEPECYLGPNRTLRRVVLVDRWDDARAIAERFDWRSLEATIYDTPMTLVVVVLGASRDGRRHGPLSRGYVHPVSQQLRFRKRDQSDFGDTWAPIFRENFKGDRDEWLEALTEDGVLEDHLILHPVELPENQTQILSLAGDKLSSLRDTVEPPVPQLGQCFDPIRKCPFRSCCPYFRMPSEELGFLRRDPTG